MNIYHLLKINRFIKIPALKSFGIWILHLFNQRYLAVYFDPVLACNLRCRMCYFSKEDRRNELKGKFAKQDLPLIAKAIFSRALKVQIGCGAEPSLYKHNAEVIRLAKQYGVPYISFTSNANLLTEEDINTFLEAGLNEITISLHGVEKQTYEYLMQNASYDIFLGVMQLLSNAKKRYPNFKIRVNYTINEKNLAELRQFFNVFGKYSIDLLQIRPVQDIGGEIKSIENKDAFINSYKEIYPLLKEKCKQAGITYIAQKQLFTEKQNESSSILDATYCYASPRFFWRSDFNWRTETFDQYAKRTRYANLLFRAIFSPKKLSDRNLNYDIN
jgi:MoaA/NifB/PqqE/SkfB family radical SAM enzyme